MGDSEFKGVSIVETWMTLGMVVHCSAWSLMKSTVHRWQVSQGRAQSFLEQGQSLRKSCLRKNGQIS